MAHRQQHEPLMRNCAYALALLVASSPAFAQAGATQSPPSPNAASASPACRQRPAGCDEHGPGATPSVSGAVGGTTTTTGPTTATAPITGTTTTPGAAMTTTVPVPVK